MTIPDFILYQKLGLNFIPNLNCWLESKNENSVQLKCNVLRQPSVNISEFGIKISDDKWIFRKGNIVVMIEDGKETIIRKDEDEYVVDYIMYNDSEIYPIYLKGRKYNLNGEEYEKYLSYLDRKILVGKRNLIIILGNKQLNIDRGERIYLSRSFISVIYDSGTKVIDREGNISYFNFKGDYLGFIQSYGIIYRSSDGLIVSSKKGNIGICVDESYLIGEFSGGLLILCGESLKQYYNTGWREIERNIDSELFVNSNRNFFGVLKKGKLYIFDSNFSKLSTFDDVNSFNFDSKRIYLFSNDGTVGLAKLEENYRPIKIINVNNSVQSPIILQVDENYFHNFSIKNGKMIDIKVVEDKKKIVIIEPFEYRKNSLEISAGNIFFSFLDAIPYTSQLPKIEFSSAKILAADEGGNLITSPDKNALLIFNIKYSIPTRSQITFTIEALNQTFKFLARENSGKKLLKIPLSINNLKLLDVPVNVYAHVDDRLIASLEFLAPIKIVRKETTLNQNKITIINNSVKKEIVVIKNGIFEWKQLFEYPLEYKGILFGKEGEKIEVDGEKIVVREGYNLVRIVKDNANYAREYLVIGIKNPIKSVNAELKENQITVKLDMETNIPFEIFYGPHSFRGISKEETQITFPIEPIYNSIKIRAYTHGFTYESQYEFVDTIKLSILMALSEAKAIKEVLSNFGIV
ncbi:protein UpsX [Saccharolobus solfataricus]